MSTEGVHHMTRTQAGVNMVPGAERQGMLGPNTRNITAKPTKPEPRVATPDQLEHQHLENQNRGHREQARWRLQEGGRRRDVVTIRSGGTGPRVSPELEEGRS